VKNILFKGKKMKIFLDTADYKKIAACAQTGLVDGVTINPTLLKVQNEAPLKIVREIVRVLPDAEINLQVTETEPHKVYEQAREIARLTDNMLVKIPCHSMYLPVIAQLIQEDIPVNVTLVFSLSQALEMSKLGVNYISVFIGRLYDNGIDGLEVAAQVQEMLDLYSFESELLVASVRTKEQVDGAIILGADAITIPVDVFNQLIEQQLSEAGIKRFADDWQNGPHKQLLE
jgi:transaldolase